MSFIPSSYASYNEEDFDFALVRKTFSDCVYVADGEQLALLQWFINYFSFVRLITLLYYHSYYPDFIRGVPH